MTLPLATIYAPPVPSSKPAAVLRNLIVDSRTAAPVEAEAPLAALVYEARRQGVTGTLLAAIEEGRLPWAFPAREALIAERRRVLVGTLGQVALAERVASLLAEQGIRSLPMKGVAVVETVCDSEADRPMSDTDLLALERWPDAVALLRRNGFVELGRADHAWALRDPQSDLVVELHRSLTSAAGLFPFDGEELWARRRRGRGQLSALPAAEGLLLQLALHATFQHGFSLSLVQWLDFRRLLEREPIDYDRVRALAERARAETPLAAALLAAEAVVGCPFPPALAPLAQRMPAALREWLRQQLASPSSLVERETARLAAVRWKLLAGRRGELLWRTLVLPETPAGETRLAARLAHAVRRSARLVAGTPRPRRANRVPPSLPPAAAATPDLSTPRSAAAPETADEVGAAEDTLCAFLAEFPEVRLTVTGCCMEPALVHGERVVLVAASRRRPRLGDVVLSRQEEGLRLHRLVWGPPLVAARARWRTKADRGRLLDPPLSAEDVLAIVTQLEERPAIRPRRPARALASLAAAVVARLRYARPLSPKSGAAKASDAGSRSS